MRQSGAGHIEIAKDVRLEGALQLLVSDLFQAVLTLLISGVVDQNVELIEIIDGRLDRCVRELRICQIAFDAHRATSFCFNGRLFPGVKPFC